VFGTAQRPITSRRGLYKALQDNNWIMIIVFLKILEKQIWNLALIPSPSALPSPGNDANFASPLQ
jgi:hypothetical protein